MKFIKNLGAKLNKIQKLIVAIVVPLVLFVITLIIAGEFLDMSLLDIDDIETWYLWGIFIVIVGYFEFHFYSENNK